MEYIIYGLKVLLDEEDLNVILQHIWGVDRNGYLYTKINRTRTVFLHRLIMNAKENEEIDHKNGNRLDIRKINLRICTSSQNKANSKKRIRKNLTSNYKGVRKRGNYWLASCKGKDIGLFVDEIEAAKAYNEKAKEIFGEFARLNIFEGQFIEKIN